MSSNNVKESSVRAMVNIGCRGKRKTNLSPSALALLTQMTNILMKETLERTAQSAIDRGASTVREEDLQRIIGQLLLDFT